MTKNNLLMQIKYDFLSILSEVMVIIFSFLFPPFMALIITSSIPLANDIPLSQLPLVQTKVVITIVLMIPVALMLVSASTSFAQEVEFGISFRMQLFGKSKSFMLLSKIITFYILMTISFIIYFTTVYTAFDLLIPKLSSLLIYLLVFYSFGTILLVIAYSLAQIIKKMGIVLGLTLPLQFIIMFLSGMMGPSTDFFPAPIQAVAKLLPTYYVNSDFSKYWVDGFAGYNFAPLIQSIIFCSVLAGVIYAINLYVNRKHV